MAKSQAQSASTVKLFIHSNDPDQMGFDRWSGGIGTIIKSVFAPAMFSRDSGKHGLFHLLTIQEEDGVEHIARYMRGFFGNTEKDGKKSIGRNSYPVREDGTIAGPLDKSLEELLEEYAQLAKGKDENNTIPQIPEEEQHLYEGVFVGSLEENIKDSNTDDKQLMGKIKELTRTDPADPESSPFTGAERSDAICGLKFQWELLDQQYPFKAREGEAKSEFKLLIPTQYFGMDEEWEAHNKANGKTKEKTTVKAEANEDETATETEADDFENDVEGRIVAFLVKTKKPLTHKDISTHIANAFKSPEERKKAIGVVNIKWLVDENRPWTYENGMFQA
jgi:hypothetical protein